MTNPFKQITSGIIISTIVGWILWDLVVASNNIPGDTESEIIRTFANHHAAFPLMVGILMGHFFWNARTGINPPITEIGLPVVAITAVLFDVGNILPWINPIFPFLLGLVGGKFLWPQRIKP